MLSPHLLPVRYICLLLHIGCLPQLHQFWDNPYLATYKLYAIPNSRLDNVISVNYVINLFLSIST